MPSESHLVQPIEHFGPLPNAVLARIAAATEVEITLWVDRVLDAESLKHSSAPDRARG